MVDRQPDREWWFTPIEPRIARFVWAVWIIGLITGAAFGRAWL